ncbi:adenylate/guanylate cyclase domain-containing protein [Mesorhizobium sp. M0615]|uniref:adenylate/guanylate cyclase domain-containing protein n=1 Tax=Mesorhizobium sp. M0615 TaxID=2956971 RepID=UPI0033363906
MAEERVQRRLAAILAADVVGYSRLMEQDEAGTLAALKARRRDVLAPLVTQHHGRIVKLMGDGVLVEFASAVDAVQCAVALQKGFAAANQGGSEARRIILRIGVNLGDVIVEGQDIYGDGVNIAARLEGLAEPGGIYVSGTVHDHIAGKLALRFHDLGDHALKNIVKPVRVYRAGADRTEERTAHPAPAMPDKPSIAVLAFTNMSGDPEQEHLSDGISEDIITALSKLSKLFVVARNSTFTYKGHPVDVKQVGREQGVRYVLEGSVRRAGNRLRITAQLIDATTSNHIWADRYDRQVQDVFDLQDEITRQVTAALQVELTEGERARLWASGTANLEAWEAAIQAPELLESHRREDVLPARRLAQRALQHDANYAVAWALLGWSYWNEAFNGWTDDPDTALAQASDALEKARSIDGTNPDTLALLAFLHISLRKLDEAFLLAEKAMLLGPNHSFATAVAANVALFSNKPHDALPLLQRARRLCPICPAWYVGDMAYAYLLMDRHDDAIKTAIEATKMDPDYIYSYHVLAVANAELGQIDAAQSAATNILRIDPNWLISTFATTQPFEDQRLQKRLVEGFRNAGLPGASDLASDAASKGW